LRRALQADKAGTADGSCSPGRYPAQQGRA
jgi:hypothetical protein